MQALDPAPTDTTVSVIICAWNAEATLSRAVESTLAQEGVGVEVLVIDDHSSDRTFDVARACQERDRRVLAFRLNQNLGPAAARNLGLDVASGS